MTDFQILVDAISTNNIDTFKQSVDKISDVNDVANFGTKSSILHYYICEASKFSMPLEKVVEILLKKGFNINIKNNDGSSCLHYCIGFKNLDLFKILIQNKAEIDIQDENGNTPLLKLVSDYRGEEVLLEMLNILVTNGASIDKKNHHDISPRDSVLRRHLNTPLTGPKVIWNLQPILNW